MPVIVAKTAGFCMGVKRAVEIARETALNSAGSAVFTLGELIHNKQVVSELADLGVKVINELPEAGTVIIRAHGVTQECKNKLGALGVEVVDATCPHVVSSQKIIAAYSEAGGAVLILGDCRHPEVIGLCGYGSAEVFVIKSLAELENLTMPQEFLFIAQTTFSKELFDQIAEVLKKKYPGCKVVDSICCATQRRQDEARVLAQACEVMVVVGGKNSANTLRLVEIGQSEGCRVYHIESAAELDKGDFAGIRNVAVTAGASTPVSAIDEVVAFLQA